MTQNINHPDRIANIDPARFPTGKKYVGQAIKLNSMNDDNTLKVNDIVTFVYSELPDGNAKQYETRQINLDDMVDVV